MTVNQDKIQDAWNQYIGAAKPVPEEIEGVRDIIVQSWRRSQKTADPFCKNVPLLSPDEMEPILSRNATLIRIAVPYLNNFYQFLKGSRHQILLADSQGCQLKCISDDDESAEPGESTAVSNGCIYSESNCGTTGVTLCLAEDKPILVLGAEHFCQLYHQCACYGAPIHDPYGHQIGCICILGSLNDYQASMMNTLSMAVHGIENELKLTQINDMLSITLHSFSSGVLLVSQDHRILQCNPLAMEILQLAGLNPTGQPLESILNADSVPDFLIDIDREYRSVECTLINCKGSPIHVSLTIKPAESPDTGFGMYLLILNTQQATHELTSRIAGYSAKYTFDSIIGESEELKRIKELGLIASQSMSNVLIFGESGTGKELFAQAIHNASSRAAGPFVAINCGSIPRDMLESELFGYEGGSFQGANENGNPGKFELANGGTLFFDEIGNMSLDAQASLLRVLQTREITRLGGRVPRTIDVRIIVATNINLLAAVQNQTFRNDLYYRLNVLNITIPPLRERNGDIVMLADHFISSYSRLFHRKKPSLTNEAARALALYNWPGNVRELENAIERAINITRSKTIQLSDFPNEIVNYCLSAQYAKTQEQKPYRMPKLLPTGDDTIMSPEIQEYHLLVNTLKEERGHAKTVAAVLGIPLSTLYRKLRKYDLDPQNYRSWSK